MASSDYGGPEESEVPLADADVYKGTTNSDYVVIRRVRLFRSKFITYHNIDENVEDNKQWILTSQCELQPRAAADIREPSTKYVRPRGQWAITTLVKPKSIGTRGQPVRLFMFTLSWPTRWAAKGYTSFSFGFEEAEEARRWHARLAECLLSLRAEKAAAAAAAAASAAAGSATPSAPHSGGGGGPAALQPRTSLGSVGAATTGRFSSSSVPVAVGAGASGVGMAKLSKRGSGDGRGPTSESSLPPQLASPASASSSPGERQRRTSASGAAKRTLVYDGTGGDAADGAAPAPMSAPVSGAMRGSSFAVASATAAAAAGLAAPTAKPAPPPKAAAPPPLPPPPPSSSDSEGPYEELEDGIMGVHGPAGHHHHHHRGSGAVLVSAGAPCRQPRGTSRGDVHHTKQRWVPYKQVNGVAIYHRPQTAGDAEAGMGGEFMVSTVVRGSPRRCLTALTSHCGNTTILGPALVQEVLQRRQAVDEKEVLRIVVQAPGVTGVICAPRELVVETVFKTDETGPTLVLMFNSCEVPARFVERRAGEQQGQGQGLGSSADEADSYQAASEGGRRSWWRRPVSARVRGGYTMAPLEEFSLDNSPEALVTCIMKVDLGGVCGERSWMRLASGLVGWTDAFLDRMLMAVTLLRDEVEQGRFVVQPLNMMASSSRVKERDREAAGGSTLDLPGLGAASRSGESAAALLAGAGAGASGGGAAGGAAAGARRATRLGSSVVRAVSKARSRKEVDRPSLIDGVAADGASFSSAVTATAASASGAAMSSAAAAAADSGGGDGAKLVEAEGADRRPGTAYEAADEEDEEEGFAEDGGDAEATSLASPGPGGPSLRPYESLEDVLDRMRGLSLLDPAVWDNLHQPGKDAPFKIRGPTYLKDRKKIPAGYSRFVLGSMDVIQQPPGVMHEHVARFIPAIRQSGAPFSVVIHLVIPGTPLLGIVATFVSDRHPSSLGTPPAQPMEDEHDWEPFDFVLHKYMTGSTHTRNHMLKLIPHIADGSWMIKQSVGTTPVILGKQLRTIYYETPQYIEIDIDISANNVASYVTGLVRGATRSLVIDMGFVLEGTTPWELPEALLGTLRLYNLDIRDAKLIDVSREIPLRPPNMAPPPQPIKHTTGLYDNSVAGGGAAGAAAAAAEPPTPAGVPGTPASAMPSAALGRVSLSRGSNGGPAAAAAAAATPAGAAAAAAAGAAQWSVGGKLAGIGGSVGGAGAGAGQLRRRGSGLSGMESAPAASPASESSPNVAASGAGVGVGSRPASAAQTPLAVGTAPLPPRGLTTVSNSGTATAAASVGGVGGGSPEDVPAAAATSPRL